MVRIGLDETAHKIFAVRPDEAYTVADIRRQLDLFKAQGRRYRRGEIFSMSDAKEKLVAFVLERMDTAMVHEIDPDYILNDKKFASYFREGRVLVTTSGNTQKTAYECCRNELGREHVMFGSDYPYENYREMADVDVTVGWCGGVCGRERG